MNTILILGNIITIIFVVKLESTRISHSERLHELKSINTLKNKVIKEYLFNYDQSEAFEILSQYILNEVEMYGFAEHLNRTGSPPEWSNTRQLKNHEHYNFLRYNEYVEEFILRRQQTGMHVSFLRKNIFYFAPRINYQNLVKFYNEKMLNDLITFEDYYAIQVLLKDDLQINWENPASRRMRKAIYSLAIRQYSSNATMNYIPKSCFFKKTETKTFVNDIKKGDSFEKTTFSICSSKFKESYSYTYEYSFHTSFYWTNYEVLITDPITMVSLEDILDVEDEELYVILPKTDLTVLSDPEIFVNNSVPNLYVKMSISPIYDRSNWLTELANEIEKYKEMEKEYFNTSIRHV
ncbi:uncharacterized protein LOC122505052 [Leptopilina heterotoma]|uniref:uncharacterized protein LOC122505052 n=1 Tax=Leptopilina heterotoma TaxID=63436 RepID=UPI001CA86496|nr:uncharacterized protein LOC122505052 [Leptopilina heterotoma]XP_043472408.1 uncharacterized protein LOC122505052 [Leptopilina heterotoma]